MRCGGERAWTSSLSCGAACAPAAICFIAACSSRASCERACAASCCRAGCWGTALRRAPHAGASGMWVMALPPRTSQDRLQMSRHRVRAVRRMESQAGDLMWGVSAAVSGGWRWVEHGWNSSSRAAWMHAAWMHAACASEKSGVLPKALERALQSGGSASSCARTRCWRCRSDSAERNCFALLSSSARPSADATCVEQFEYFARLGRWVGQTRGRAGCACRRTSFNAGSDREASITLRCMLAPQTQTRP